MANWQTEFHIKSMHFWTSKLVPTTLRRNKGHVAVFNREQFPLVFALCHYKNNAYYQQIFLADFFSRYRSDTKIGVFGGLYPWDLKSSIPSPFFFFLLVTTIPSPFSH